MKLLLAIFMLFFTSSSNAGTPIMKCDERINRSAVFEKFLSDTNYKERHSTFQQWRARRNLTEIFNCWNRGHGLNLTFTFELPSSLSKYEFEYVYNLYLVIDEEKSVLHPYPNDPERTIKVVEEIPIFSEFAERYKSEIRSREKGSRCEIFAHHYGKGLDFRAPLQIRCSVSRESSGTGISVSPYGLVSGNFYLKDTWANVKGLDVGLELAREAAKNKGCIIDESPKAVVIYYSKRTLKDGEPHMLQGYDADCLKKREHVYVLIYPNSARYEVEFPGRMIASGVLSKGQLKRIEN